MATNKESDPGDKLLLPKRKDLEKFPEPAITKHRDGSPLYPKDLQWPIVFKPAINLFKNHLLQTPLFRLHNDNTLSLYDPRGPQISCKNTELVLYGLSGELLNFFSKIKTPQERYWLSILDVIDRTQNDLIKCGRTFIGFGVVKQDAYLKTFHKFQRWSKSFLRKLSMGVEPVHRNDLVGSLYPYFKTFTPLPDDGIYCSIAHILKYLGIENGDIRKITQRIKRDFFRKRDSLRNRKTTKTIDETTLKRTVSYLKS